MRPRPTPGGAIAPAPALHLSLHLNERWDATSLSRRTSKCTWHPSAHPSAPRCKPFGVASVPVRSMMAKFDELPAALTGC